MTRRAAIATALPLLLGGCGNVDSSGPREVTASFYAAVAAGNGREACSQLSRATLEALEEQQQRSCPRAVLQADVADPKAQVRAVEVAATEAAVELGNGRFVFLDHSSGRWEVTAADCRPSADRSPFDCAVED